jgi:alkylation response protein AidB-like acyl-CoA dehydrogenase
MTFRPPVRDLALALKVAGHDGLIASAFPDLDAETVSAVLEAAGSFAADVLAPLNRVGDTKGATYANGVVTAAPGFAQAYKAFADGGWNSLSAEPEHGGQGLSKALELSVYEMVQSANMAFGLCPMLTQAAIESLTKHGDERQKTIFLPKLVSGEWTGAMVLTEPQAGTDLSAIATRATDLGNGKYALNGQKIYITWGDHDCTDNIAYLVLARSPNGPAGIKGLSLYLTYKYLVDEEGRIGARNGVRPVSIEHKLGIHGSPTCVMAFDDAEAELVGELNQGLPNMFVLMNAARLEVGVQGVAIAERAFQQALAFSQERQQGRTAFGDAGIYGHPDVRRTLMLMKAKIEAARGICLATGVIADFARLSDDPEARARFRARQDLLTPIAKAWSTDLGVEAASAGVQVHGGMGFIEETGAAQHYRDARIPPIYEGTNGIQALDLIGRKLKLDQGAAMRALCDDIDADATAFVGDLAIVGERVRTGVAALREATAWVLAQEAIEPLAAATPYLKLAGDVVGGAILGRQAVAAGDADEWAKSKTALARLYASQILTGAPGLAEAVMSAQADELSGVSAQALAG